jgi:hypothetical protein
MDRQREYDGMLPVKDVVGCDGYTVAGECSGGVEALSGCEPQLGILL